MIGIAPLAGSDHRLVIRRLLTFVLIACASRPLWSQATPFVPPYERVYRDIERLAAAGLIRTMVTGVRPFTEREVVRLLIEARSNLPELGAEGAWATQTIAEELSRYQRTANKPVDRIAAEGAYMSSPYRFIEPDPNGQIDAFINPFAAYRGGRVLADGGTGALESRHTATLGSHVAVALEPRAWIAGNGDSSHADFRVQAASVDLLFGNLSIVAGRDYFLYGQAPTGGLLLSENAPPLDMIRVGNDQPFVLPWIFRLLGPMRADAFVSDLGGGAQIHPHARLGGYHLAILPHPNVEIGAEVIDAMGGQGGQPASLGDRILDAFPIVDAVFRRNSDFEFSNKLAGADFHLRVPSWAGFELYGEGDVDDLDVRRLHSSLFQDGGYIVGTSWTCIVECGRFGLRAEYRRTGIRYYTHADFPIERNTVLLGDPLGPRGEAGYLTLNLDDAKTGSISLIGAFEVRSGNQYASQTTGTHSEGFHFIQVAHRPGEKRARIEAEWMPSARNARLTPRVTAGLEHVMNYAFVSGADRTNALLSVGLVLRPWP